MMQIGSLLLLFFVIFLGMLTKKWPLRPSPLAAANPALDAGALMMGVIVGTNGVVLSPFPRWARWPAAVHRKGWT
ncbi:hypothetical protein [Acidaminococcus timonensis]|uniref:hypothetical protein n=1 Tax=Acidaminococcus timonensis TaxID=1871002 RepID=UPI00307B27CF